jgi:hypothetical protein
MKVYLSALVSGHDVMSHDVPPRPAGESPYVPVMLNASAREHWLFMKKRHDEFEGAEKKGTSAMMFFCGTNATAQRVLRNFLRQAEVEEDNANAAAMLLDPAHVPQPARAPRARDQLRALTEHFDPQSELLSIVRMEEAKRVVFREHESVSSFMVRFDDAINHVDMVRPTPIPQFEKRQMLDTAMTNSRDLALQALTTHLQMAPPGGTWDELKAVVIRFDMTTAGMRRIVKNPVVSALEDSGKPRDKRKRGDQHPLCTECDRRHGGDTCWKTHPELKPDWVKKRDADNQRKKNKGPPQFTFGESNPDTTSMLTSYENTGEDEVSFLMEDGTEGILVDTGASNRLLLLTDRTPIEHYQLSDKVIGTAHHLGQLQVRGTGYIGEQPVDHCPELRKSIVSHGRIRAWGCGLMLPIEGGPELHKDGRRLLRGTYVRDMPVFSLEEILDVARNQPEGTMVMALTRSDTQRLA